MAYDATAFEDDWWLLSEEQLLERIPEMKWTLGGGGIIRCGEDIGAYALSWGPADANRDQRHAFGIPKNVSMALRCDCFRQFGRRFAACCGNLADGHFYRT